MIRRLAIPRLKHDFHDSIGSHIHMTNHAFRKAVNEELVQLGVTFRQFQVLAWLAFDGDLTQAELAERMEVEAATIVGIVDCMERDGWITRCADPTDRRKKVLRPTDQVEPLWNQMVGCIHRVRRRAFAGVSQEQLDQLKETLKRIQENLREVENPASRSVSNRSSALAPSR